MKILFGVYPWAFDCPGGGERQLLAYKKHLSGIGVQVDFYNQWDPCIKEYDIFHFFSVMPGSYQLCNYVKSQGLKLVVSPNLWVTQETKNNYPHEEIRHLMHLADMIVVNSEAEKSSLASVYELPDDRFSVVYNGIESSFLASKNTDCFLKNYAIEFNYIFNVANIEPRKNQLNFLKALKEFPELKLVTAGHVRDNQYAEECKKLGGDQFVHIGEVPYGSDLLRSAYMNCDFFAMPSTLETPSIAALEAAACGAKILITSEGSTKEYFKDLAIYVDPFEIKSIVRAIDSTLVKDSEDDLKEIIKNQYTWEKVVASLQKAYSHLLE